VKKTTTKSLLAQSLLELSKTMAVEKITITDITERCSLRRESFYYHFYDKYQLIRWMCEQNFTKTLNQSIGKEPWNLITSRFLQSVRLHREFYQSVLTDTNMNNLRSSIVGEGAKVMSAFVSDKSGKKLSYDMKFHIYFHCYGAVNMICDWIKDGMVEEEEQISRLITVSMPEALKVFFIPAP
jgi:probable dihydroxyacetone kinase regulator